MKVRIRSLELVWGYQTPINKIALAPPPPLHIPATPSSPGLRVLASRAVIRAPEAPNGCPIEIAPP